MITIYIIESNGSISSKINIKIQK